MTIALIGNEISDALFRRSRRSNAVACAWSVEPRAAERVEAAAEPARMSDCAPAMLTRLVRLVRLAQEPDCAFDNRWSAGDCAEPEGVDGMISGDEVDSLARLYEDGAREVSEGR